MRILQDIKFLEVDTGPPPRELTLYRLHSELPDEPSKDSYVNGFGCQAKALPVHSLIDQAARLTSYNEISKYCFGNLYLWCDSCKQRKLYRVRAYTDPCYNLVDDEDPRTTLLNHGVIFLCNQCNPIGES